MQRVWQGRSVCIVLSCTDNGNSGESEDDDSKNKSGGRSSGRDKGIGLSQFTLGTQPEAEGGVQHYGGTEFIAKKFIDSSMEKYRPTSFLGEVIEFELRIELMTRVFAHVCGVAIQDCDWASSRAFLD